jgi:hypothetical protein
MRVKHDVFGLLELGVPRYAGLAITPLYTSIQKESNP